MLSKAFPDKMTQQKQLNEQEIRGFVQILFAAQWFQVPPPFKLSTLPIFGSDIDEIQARICLLMGMGVVALRSVGREVRRALMDEEARFGHGEGFYECGRIGCQYSTKCSQCFLQ